MFNKQYYIAFIIFLISSINLSLSSDNQVFDFETYIIKPTIQIDTPLENDLLPFKEKCQTVLESLTLSREGIRKLRTFLPENTVIKNDFIDSLDEIITVLSSSGLDSQSTIENFFILASTIQTDVVFTKEEGIKIESAKCIYMLHNEKKRIYNELEYIRKLFFKFNSPNVLNECTTQETLDEYLIFPVYMKNFSSNYGNFFSIEKNEEELLILLSYIVNRGCSLDINEYIYDITEYIYDIDLRMFAAAYFQFIAEFPYFQIQSYQYDYQWSEVDRSEFPYPDSLRDDFNALVDSPIRKIYKNNTLKKIKEKAKKNQSDETIISENFHTNISYICKNVTKDYAIQTKNLHRELDEIYDIVYDDYYALSMKLFIYSIENTILKLKREMTISEDSIVFVDANKVAPKIETDKAEVLPPAPTDLPEDPIHLAYLKTIIIDTPAKYEIDAAIYMHYTLKWTRYVKDNVATLVRMISNGDKIPTKNKIIVETLRDHLRSCDVEALRDYLRLLLKC